MILFFLIVILKDPRGPKKALGQKYNHKRQLIKIPIKKTEKTDLSLQAAVLPPLPTRTARSYSS